MSGQLRVGPGRERLAHPQVEFVFGQPPLDERRLEHLDHLLAVSVRRAELATALALLRRLSHLQALPSRRLPTSVMQRKRNPVPLC